jgi:hypothetical protein
MAQLKDILSHPDFIGLPDSEKQKALTELIPGFGDLPQEEQMKGMAEIMGRVAQPPAAIPAPAPSTTDPTAASMGMFAPGNLTPSMETLREQAPVAGAMITAPFRSNPIMAPIAGMGSSAAALMAGQGVDPMQGQTPDIMAGSLGQFNAPLAPFLMGAGAEAGGQALMGVAGKALAPFKESFAAKLASSPETKMAQELVDQGVPLSPGGYGGAKRFQWIADNFMPGSLIVNKRRQEVADAILKMRQEFIENTMGMPKYTESIPQAQAKTRELFGQFAEQAGGKETAIPMTNTVKFIEDNMSNPITTADIWWKKKYIPWMKGGEAKTVDEINTLHATYNRSWNKLTPVGKDLRNGIRESIYKDLAENDLQTGLQLEEALKTAQAAAKTPRDIAKSRWIENALLDPATKVEDQAFIFYPAQFQTQVNKNITKIEQMFGQEGVDIFKKFADKMMLAAPDMGKLGKVSDATAAFRKGTGLGMLTIPGAVAAGQPGMAAALAVPYGFQTIAAKSLMNPSGWLRKWLTTGLEPSKLFSKEVPKLGMLEAMND